MDRNIVLTMAALVSIIKKGDTIAPEDKILFCTLRDQLTAALHEISRGLYEEKQVRPSPSLFQRYQHATQETRRAQAVHAEELRTAFRCSSQRRSGLVKRLTQTAQAIM